MTPRQLYDWASIIIIIPLLFHIVADINTDEEIPANFNSLNSNLQFTGEKQNSNKQLPFLDTTVTKENFTIEPYKKPTASKIKLYHMTLPLPRKLQQNIISMKVKHAFQTCSSKEMFKDHISSNLWEAITLAKNNGIVLLTIPSHTSHKLQPLDRTVFGPYKDFYNQAASEWMLSNAGKPMGIHEVAEIAGKAYATAFTMKKIVKGFKITGIFPLHEQYSVITSSYHIVILVGKPRKSKFFEKKCLMQFKMENLVGRLYLMRKVGKTERFSALVAKKETP